MLRLRKAGEARGSSVLVTAFTYLLILLGIGGGMAIEITTNTRVGGKLRSKKRRNV